MTIITRLFKPSARPRAARKVAGQSYQAVSEMAGTLRRYRELPLRIQSEWLMMFLVSVVSLALIAGLYLNVTARTAITGREIQSLEAQISVNQRYNADLQTQIAIQLSNNVLEQRAKAMGFKPLDRENLVYIVVPGYFPERTVTMVEPTSETDVLAMTPGFSESLFEWLAHELEKASVPLARAR